MMQRLQTVTNARRAAFAATALIAVTIVFHVYWAAGGSWALHAIGRVHANTSGGRIFYAAIAILAAASAVELLILARALPRNHRLPAFRRLVWVLAAILILGGLARMGSAPAVGLMAFVLGLLFAEVAYASPHEAKTAEALSHRDRQQRDVV
jgi:hypothetical protein